MPYIFINTGFLIRTWYSVQFPVLGNCQAPTVGRAAWLCRNVIPVVNISKKIQVVAWYPELCKGLILSLLCLLPCWGRKVFFTSQTSLGLFFSSRFSRKLLSRKLKQLPEQSQTVCKLWLSQRSIFWCTAVSNAGDTFCPLVLCCVTTHHTENSGKTHKKKTILTVNPFLDVYGNP